MQKNRLRNIAFLGCLSLSQTLSLALFFNLPLQAQPKSPQPSAATQDLNRMFSLDIQKTLNACTEQKLVNIAAGADGDGSVICGNGFRNSSVQFTNYMNTSSDFLAAGFLVGFLTAYKNDSSLTPPEKAQMLALFLTPSGKTFLRQMLEQELTESEIVVKGSTQSLSLLVNDIMQRSLPILKNQGRLENLLGTPNQYKLVVEKFCTSPGMSVAQAKTLMPGLSSIQLYSICIQESGIVVSIPKTQEAAINMRQAALRHSLSPWD